MPDGRLPAHIEVSGMLRAVEAAGGFATVLRKGEKTGGVILVLTMECGRDTCLWERMPQLDGRRIYSITRRQDDENPHEFAEYMQRRRGQDPDSWIIELDVTNPERFIAESAG
ncbi:DUF1491 family protein [Qipengyuania marisflavi]|uniref:DUF1491 family protein n=1 Tax=Qipengyuania marisflavi TaxID=2486356 RepID=UPI00248261DE|nr:DUF1491 family protein [Qipengyuania marisflavi]